MKALRLLLPLLIAAGLIWLTLRGQDLGQLWLAILQVSVPILALGIAAEVGSIFLRAVRYRRLMHYAGDGGAYRHYLNGTVIGYFWNRMAAKTARPEFTVRMGVLLATGLVVGDSLFGLAFAGAVGAVGDPAKLAIVGDGFAPLAEWIGVGAVIALLWFSYARTRNRALITAA